MPQSLEERMATVAAQFIDNVVEGAGDAAPAVIRAAVEAINVEAHRRRLTEPATLTPDRRRWIIERLVAYDIYEAERMLGPQDTERFWKWVAVTLREHRPYDSLSDAALAAMCEFLGLDRSGK